MNDWSLIKTIFLALAAFAIGYAVWQSFVLGRSLRSIDSREPEKGERVFQRRQHRRRIQISILIGICGACMFAGVHFSHETHKGYFALSWALATLFISWTMLLALVDAMSIRLHFKRIHNRNIAEESKFRYQLEQEMKKQEKRDSVNESRENP